MQELLKTLKKKNSSPSSELVISKEIGSDGKQDVLNVPGIRKGAPSGCTN